MPQGAMWLHDVDAAVFVDRSLVVVADTGDPGESTTSVALLSPAVP